MTTPTAGRGDPTIEPVVLVPSPLLGPTVWAPVAAALRDGGRRVIELAAPEAAPAGPSDVLARILAAIPPDVACTLVAHSNAGLYMPQVVDRRSAVQALVLVDAGLAPSQGSVPLAPPAFLDHLRGLAGPDDVLPAWTRWFDEDDVAALFPDDATRATVESAQQRLPLACLDATLDVPGGWDVGRRLAYLAFGDTYGDELDDARRRGWPTAVMDGRHLHMLVDPPGVAEAILELAHPAAPPAGRA